MPHSLPHLAYTYTTVAYGDIVYPVVGFQFKDLRTNPQVGKLLNSLQLLRFTRQLSFQSMFWPNNRIAQYYMVNTMPESHAEIGFCNEHNYATG